MTTTALLRSGGLGDILMTLHLISLLKKQRPGEVHYYCDPGLNPGEYIMKHAGVDKICNMEDRLARKWDVAFALYGYPYSQGYPHVPMWQHLIKSFAKEMNIEVSDEDLPSAVIPAPPLPEGVTYPYATIHPWSPYSNYKCWPIDRWSAIVAKLDIPVYQIGVPGNPVVKGADQRFIGSPIDTSVGLVGNAAFHLGIDSFANHLTHFSWTGTNRKSRKVPSLILWGSTQPSASGYKHNINVSLNLPCQPCFRQDPDGPGDRHVKLGPCPNPPLQIYDEMKHACMDGISIQRVLTEALKLQAKI